MCILRGRLSSTTKGPVTSPKEICPETRSELIERILARPQRATNTLASIWGAVWADAAEGSKKRSAMQSVLSVLTVLSFMESMVAADSGERDGQSVPRPFGGGARGTPQPRRFAKRSLDCLIPTQV